MERQEGLKSNIILVGPMGSGKTTVGQILAINLGWRFIDTDQLIVERTGKEIPLLFEEQGEEYFRQVEKEVISRFSQISRTVIATGGGAVIDRTNYQLLKENGLVFYLKASPSVLTRRVGSGKGRPLLLGKDIQAIVVGLLKEREKYYQEADLTIETDFLTPYEVADLLIMESKKNGLLE